MIRRHDDVTNRSVFQSDRFFLSNGKWFFNTREAVSLGPFERRPDAERALSEYVAARTGLRVIGIDPWNTPGASR